MGCHREGKKSGGKVSNAAERHTGASGFDPALPANLASVVSSVGVKL